MKTDCQIHLEFKSEIKKPSIISDYFNAHNHDLEFVSANAINEEIRDMFVRLYCTGSSIKTIASIIHSKFAKKFHWRTIYYQVSKLKNL